jgi:phosphoenolpyruvate-protein kinase (PTS system EI component)
VVIWPTDETVANARTDAGKIADLPPPGEPVAGFKVMANINLASDVEEANEMKAEGIGLYRTEMEIIATGKMLSEDEMYQRYSSVVDAMKGGTVTFRVFDIGSDKPFPFLNIRAEQNPSLGWRGARLLLGNKDLLRSQARALARASRHGPVSIMYPMIVDLEQFIQLKNVVEESIKDLPHGSILHGTMFEVPSACLDAEEILKAADFGSIGTNDLIQYLFAVDRNNEFVAYDFNAARPALWKLIGKVADAARSAGKPLSVCGEVAGDTLLTAKIRALGIDTVSVNPRLIPAVRKAAEKT